MSNVPVMNNQSGKLLIFSLQGSHYALNLAQVAEVGDSQQISPIPLAPAYYTGALNFHGNIVAVIDLAQFLGLTGCSQPKKLVVIHQDIASLAFLVDSVIRIVSEEDASFHTHADNRFAVSSLGLHDGEAILLDLAALIRGAEIGIQKGR